MHGFSLKKSPISCTRSSTKVRHWIKILGLQIQWQNQFLQKNNGFPIFDHSKFWKDVSLYFSKWIYSNLTFVFHPRCGTNNTRTTMLIQFIVKNSSVVTDIIVADLTSSTLTSLCEPQPTTRTTVDCWWPGIQCCRPTNMEQPTGSRHLGRNSDNLSSQT